MMTNPVIDHLHRIYSEMAKFEQAYPHVAECQRQAIAALNQLRLSAHQAMAASEQTDPILMRLSGLRLSLLCAVAQSESLTPAKTDAPECTADSDCESPLIARLSSQLAMRAARLSVPAFVPVARRGAVVRRYPSFS